MSSLFCTSHWSGALLSQVFHFRSLSLHQTVIVVSLPITWEALCPPRGFTSVHWADSASLQMSHNNLLKEVCNVLCVILSFTWVTLRDLLCQTAAYLGGFVTCQVFHCQ